MHSYSDSYNNRPGLAWLVVGSTQCLCHDDNVAFVTLGRGGKDLKYAILGKGFLQYDSTVS